MNFAIRLSYPENNEYSWAEALQQYADVGSIEAAFYSTELFLRNVKVEDVVEPFRKTPSPLPLPRRGEDIEPDFLIFGVKNSVFLTI